MGLQDFFQLLAGAGKADIDRAARQVERASDFVDRQLFQISEDDNFAGWLWELADGGVDLVDGFVCNELVACTVGMPSLFSRFPSRPVFHKRNFFRSHCFR